jgi:hypothetical protein
MSQLLNMHWPSLDLESSISLPAPVIEKVGRFYVVRDDLLAGGSKMRYILPLIQSNPNSEWVYASPAFGYAQIALAHCCAMIGVKATIFTAQRKELHARTLRAEEAGAKIVMIPNGYLSVVQFRARTYAKEVGASLVPFGVDHPQAIAEFSKVAVAMPIKPREVWACAGSGTLSRALQSAWPESEFNAVQVGAKCNVDRAKLWKALEKFEQPSKIIPPFPSCSNYDAKVWSFIQEHGSDGALFWNVGA